MLRKVDMHAFNLYDVHGQIDMEEISSLLYVKHILFRVIKLIHNEVTCRIAE